MKIAPHHETAELQHEALQLILEWQSVHPPADLDRLRDGHLFGNEPLEIWSLHHCRAPVGLTPAIVLFQHH